MANGEETRGQVARTMAGADGVEIKAMIPEKQIDIALELYKLVLDDNERFIYFFDTPDLELFETGIIARARRIVGSDHDSTIKFRPVVPESVPAIWRKHGGFKLEADASDKGVVKSASLTMPVAKGLIKRVAAGKDPIASLFTEQQLLFLLSMANKKIDYEKVVVKGPCAPGGGNTTTQVCRGRLLASSGSGRMGPGFSRSPSRPRSFKRLPRVPDSWRFSGKSAPSAIRTTGQDSLGPRAVGEAATRFDPPSVRPDRQSGRSTSRGASRGR